MPNSSNRTLYNNCRLTEECMACSGSCKTKKLYDFCSSCYPTTSIGSEGSELQESSERLHLDGYHFKSPPYPEIEFNYDRLGHLTDLHQLTCSTHLRCSTYRTDEDGDGYDSGKPFLSPTSDFSQDYSDVDSVSISNSQECSFKSVSSSPWDSPSRTADIGQYGSVSVNKVNSDQEEQVASGKPGAEVDDTYQVYDNMSPYSNHVKQNVWQKLDFQNNVNIWYPPPPEDGDSDEQIGHFDYDDEDDDLEESCVNFSSSCFADDAFPMREKANNPLKEHLRNVVRRHFKALVSQLLKDEDINANMENWLEIVSSLAWHAASFVKPDIKRGRSMDPSSYVKVKCIASGSPSDSTLIKGIVFTKNVKHKRMISQHKRPRLLLLGGALEYQRVSNKLASINTVMEEESCHLKRVVAKIEAHHPNVVLVEKSVSSYVQEYLLTKEISLVLNVKRSILDRISHCTGSQIVPSIDCIELAQVGQCEMFRLQKFVEEYAAVNHSNKKPVKTLMYFEGCPRRLGCTVILRGSYLEVLKKIKHVVSLAVFAAYHLLLETSFFLDEGATLSKCPFKASMSIPENLMIADAAIGKTSRLLCLRQTASEIPRKSASCENTFLGNPEGVIQDIEGRDKRNLAAYKHMKVATDELVDRADGFDLNEKYHSAANNQSIILSLSSTCVHKETVCKFPQLIRIKFYANGDKPLGRYLLEDLFDKTSSCRSCNESPEMHVHCFTHVQGSLTISVRQLFSMKLPGERDGRIWMWHRCLLCEPNVGVPPATHWVPLSDAAWGLSFGKFMELSFSNNATANRLASCGHSLQKDCLRFYGFGDMVACFRYSPIDVLSVSLPPLILDFSSHTIQQWLRNEAIMIISSLNMLHFEVLDVLQRIEHKIVSDNEGVNAIIRRHILHLKNCLNREKNEYDALLKPPCSEDVYSSEGIIDILELNWLKLSILIDSILWDHRLCLLDSFAYSKSSAKVELQVDDDYTPFSQTELYADSVFMEGKLGNYVEECTERLDSKNLSTMRNQELSMQVLECNTSNLVDVDFSMNSVEAHFGFVGVNSVSGRHKKDAKELDYGRSSDGFLLESLFPPMSNLSDRIDLAWTGSTGSSTPSLADQLTRNVEFTSYSSKSSPSNRKLMAPVRVHSFDSALRLKDRHHQESSPLSLQNSSFQSLSTSTFSGDATSIPSYWSVLFDLSPTSLGRFNLLASHTSALFDSCPTSLGRFNLLASHTPVFISSSFMIGEGARFLIPQAGLVNAVVAIYDNEPTSMIAYAISSFEHANFVQSQTFGLVGSKPGHGRDINELKELHFRFSFYDEHPVRGGKVKFSVTCYFAKQFAALRKKCCPNDLDFIRSLCRCKKWNAQGGKSNVYFAKSLEERFIIKQVTRTEMDSFEDFAPEYFKHLTESMTSGNPTCLAKVLGIYLVTVKHLKGEQKMKMEVLVMENLFYGRNIARVYDLKGSSRGDTILILLVKTKFY
ncbi:hypothetical protein HPP92_020986 [Vanilla planifolia]|uniref:1-phosphatidylinositol-3-phosphate 5-kinase n=1 Tax=Vanilla planifolia TaxID=51239 RepID=A0A835Q1H4_VANPL|nr:hypothetical protein HPP92_021273 [Vanilla planifolia]KAG0462510.1 hypothetical protein HPP92_020986 [Vanilla planifolia]